MSGAASERGLRRFHGNDPSYKMGRVSFCSGTNRPLVPSARAQDKEYAA